VRIFVWPDGTWCEPCEYEDGGMALGDDFAGVDVPDDVEDVDAFALEVANGRR
jgi:hypothetical protein